MTARRSCSSSCRRATSARRHSPSPPPFPRVPRCVAHDYSCAPCLQNCLREIRTSLEKSKPLVLVQEADPAKGGGTLQALPARPQLDDPAGECALLSPHTALRGGVAAAAARQHSLTHTVAARLQELRAQCPEVLQPEIFDSGWAQTTWHRIDEYQRVSLKIISEVPPRTTLCSSSAVASTLTAAPSQLPSGAPPLLATLPEPDLPPALHPGRGPGPADLLLQVRRALGLAVR